MSCNKECTVADELWFAETFDTETKDRIRLVVFCQEAEFSLALKRAHARGYREGKRQSKKEE